MPRGRGKAAPKSATADARLAKFAKRKEKLRTKAWELVTRCGVDVAVVCAGPGGGDGGGLDCCWPSKEAVDKVVRRYNALEPAERGRHREDVAERVAGEVAQEREKLARAWQAGLASALGSYDGSLEGMPEEKLRELLASIEAALVAARGRVLKLRAPPPADRATPWPGSVHDDREAAEEDSASATNNVAPPWGEADAGAGAGGGGLGRPPSGSGENSTNPPPNAVPFDAGEEEEMVAENVVAGEDPGDDVPILQPPGDADADDAEWLRSLVDDIKKQPQPSSHSAEIEYINVGNFWMERDAYDFIRFDIGMPPPGVALNYLDDDDDGGEPLKLWSWDNTMPPPSKVTPYCAHF